MAMPTNAACGSRLGARPSGPRSSAATTNVLAGTGIRTLRAKPVFTTPNVFPPVGFEQADVADARFRETVEPQHCYVCKAISRVHHFYDQLCPDCAAFNYAKRSRPPACRARWRCSPGSGQDRLPGRDQAVALRHRADRRHPLRDAAARYAAEADFAEWGDNLEIIGLDLRHTPSVEAFCSHVLQTRDRLDFIVNNACQTVRRPSDFYSHMMEDRRTRVVVAGRAGAGRGLRGASPLRDAAGRPDRRSVGDGRTRGCFCSGSGTDAGRRAVAGAHAVARRAPHRRRYPGRCFPRAVSIRTFNQVDLRDRNSWRLLLHEVSSSSCSRPSWSTRSRRS